MKSYGFFYLFLGLLMASVLPACVPQKASAGAPDSNLKLVWGSGGGVTGSVTEYVLLPSGQLYRREAYSQELKELRRIPEAEARALFAQAEKAELSFKHPGNLYHFVKLEADTALRGEAVWGDPRFTPTGAVQTLYRQLQALIQ